MLALNTFGPQLLPLLALPLLACRGERADAMAAARGSGSGGKKNAAVRSVPPLRVLGAAVLGAGCAVGAAALATACNAALQRRHLMVWRVFAPKVRERIERER